MASFDTEMSVQQMLVRNIFYGKIGLSVFEDAIVLAAALKDVDVLRQIENLMEEQDIYKKWAMLELKMKFLPNRLTHEGKPLKFIDLYNELTRARVIVKTIIAQLMMKQGLDLTSPNLGIKGWVQEET